MRRLRAFRYGGDEDFDGAIAAACLPLNGNAHLPRPRALPRIRHLTAIPIPAYACFRH